VFSGKQSAQEVKLKAFKQNCINATSLRHNDQKLQFLHASRRRKTGDISGARHDKTQQLA